jgi:flavodoxin I
MQLLLGKDSTQIFDVANAKASDLEQFTNIIFGASTWNIGDLQDDFEEFMTELNSANLKGKRIAIFGFGDQETYVDSFVDAIGHIYKALVNKGCGIVGKVSTDGYEYEESLAEVDGQFIGLPLDEDNQSDLTDQRVKAWVEQLKSEFK